MQLPKIDSTEMTVSDKAFGRVFNEGLVHQAVTAYLAASHRNTKALKNRSAVRGGGSKPWRQKGTGRARAGTSRSPLWRGGGVTFAPASAKRPLKLNRKMYRAAMASILSELVRAQRLHIMEDIAVSSPKTRELVAKLRQLALPITGKQSVLILTDRLDANLLLAARNLSNVEGIELKGLNPVNLMRFDHVLTTTNAVKQIDAWLA